MKQAGQPHPLNRDGSARHQRSPRTLDPTTAPLDDRDFADWLVFAHAYAEKLNYYDEDFELDGHWQAFIESDPAVRIALFARHQPSSFRLHYQELQNDGKHVEMGRLLNRNLLEINDLALRLPVDLLFREEILRFIRADLIRPVGELVLAYLSFPDAIPLAGPLLRGLAPFWKVDSLTSSGAISAAQFGQTLDDAFDAILRARTYLTGRATSHLDRIEAMGASHKPHLGLFFSFLKLFGEAQKKLNDLTRRQLDYYYQRVLGIQPGPAHPDRVFVLFSLARQVATHKLKKGVLFRAGKDPGGKERLYALKDEIVLNRAEAARFKTIYKRFEDDRLFAAAVANSGDGQGAPLEEADPAWLLFGGDQFPRARIGLAFASPIFQQTAGLKTITLELYFLPGQFEDFQERVNAFEGLTQVFEFEFSGEEGWTPAVLQAIQLDSNAGGSLRFEIQVPREAPIIGYDPELHPGRFPTRLPVLRILLNSSAETYAYALFQGLNLGRVVIGMKVKGDNNLVLRNDTGPVDPAKPILPFGARPVSGSAFYIGSPEVFAKQLESLDIHLQWRDPPLGGIDAASMETYYAAYPLRGEKFEVSGELLDQQAWRGLGERDLFPGTPDPTDRAASTIRFGSSSDPLFSHAQPDAPDFDSFSLDLERGFLRLKLSAPSMAFGHKHYPNLYAEAVIAKVSGITDPPPPPLPNEPYTPAFNSISLDYQAKVDMIFTEDWTADSNLEIFHLGPFGEWRVEKQPGLLPVMDSRGALYIGLSGAEPNQNISLLFQLDEGSGDPFVTMPEVAWSYLRDNLWQPLKSSDILRDGTLGLVRSGILEIRLPEDATLNQTRLDPGHHWLRASVAENVAAVSRVIAVHAQAAELVFRDTQNDPAHYETPLGPENITKMKVKDKAVKQVFQPDSSFGAKPREKGLAYYTRVSERLRHKGYAVTLWDYEHLVLEAFPQIHKVKCITHASEERELAPGHVLLTVIPDLANRNAPNPYKPAVSQATLTEVERYLATRISPFVKLKVVNPLYEEIQVDTRVVFRDGFDRGFYERQLDEDLRRYLAPWAFRRVEDIAFGGAIRRSVILNFVEELPYVDYLSDFKIARYIEGGTPELNADELRTTTARSIFITSPNHLINTS